MGRLLDLFDKYDTSKAHRHIRHYADAYEKQIDWLVGRNFTMLEIGVSGGASLQAWREYFGPNFTYFGMDINPECNKWNEGLRQRVFIGNQSKQEHLMAMVMEANGFDLVIDDGSHNVEDQQETLKTLWPFLNPGGVYVVEDLHTSYHKFDKPCYGGGPVRKPGTAIDMLKNLVDDVNRKWVEPGGLNVYLDGLESMTFYDSMCFLHKIGTWTSL